MESVLKMNLKENISKYDTTVSLAKAIGIIFVVVGHSGCPTMLSRFIYQFHMPLFFFLSGFFYKETNVKQSIRYMLKKVKGLWWPFQKWCLPFVFLQPIFDSMGFMKHSLGSTAIMKQTLLCIFNMSGATYFSSGVWFLRDMFIGLIFLTILLLLFNRFTKSFDQSMLCAVILIFALYCLFNYFELNICISGKKILQSRTFYSTAFICLGWYFKKYIYDKIMRMNICLSGIISFSFLIFATFCLPKTSINVGLSHVHLGLMTSLMGLILVLSATRIFKKSSFLTEIMQFIGDNSIIIFFLHTLSFKIVSLYLVYECNFPIDQLANVSIKHSYYWMLYTLVGVGLPMLVYYFWLKYISNKFSLDSIVFSLVNKVLPSV